MTCSARSGRSWLPIAWPGGRRQLPLSTSKSPSGPRTQVAVLYVVQLADSSTMPASAKRRAASLMFRAVVLHDRGLQEDGRGTPLTDGERVVPRRSFLAAFSAVAHAEIFRAVQKTHRRRDRCLVTGRLLHWLLHLTGPDPRSSPHQGLVKARSGRHEARRRAPVVRGDRDAGDGLCEEIIGQGPAVWRLVAVLWRREQLLRPLEEALP